MHNFRMLLVSFVLTGCGALTDPSGDPEGRGDEADGGGDVSNGNGQDEAGADDGNETTDDEDDSTSDDAGVNINNETDAGRAAGDGGQRSDAGEEGICMPSEEVCDGRDNNCNGTVDDVYYLGCVVCNPELQGECGVGGGCVCKEDGNWECVFFDGECEENGFCRISNRIETCENGCGGSGCIPGTDQVCVPTEEICDGTDNNCDGETDEDYHETGTGCYQGDGVCRRFGVMACQPDGSNTCVDPDTDEPIPTDGFCEGGENKCTDGDPDDPRFGQYCETTGCRGELCAPEPGVLDCGLGALICIPDCSPSETPANDLDDDCDGYLDEEGPDNPPCENHDDCADCMSCTGLICVENDDPLFCIAASECDRIEGCLACETDEDCPGLWCGCDGNTHHCFQFGTCDDGYCALLNHDWGDCEEGQECNPDQGCVAVHPTKCQEVNVDFVHDDSCNLCESDDDCPEYPSVGWCDAAGKTWVTTFAGHCGDDGLCERQDYLEGFAITCRTCETNDDCQDDTVECQCSDGNYVCGNYIGTCRDVGTCQVNHTVTECGGPEQCNAATGCTTATDGGT